MFHAALIMLTGAAVAAEQETAVVPHEVIRLFNGKTVVVGGLKRTRDIDSFSGVPWTEHIPILRALRRLTTLLGERVKA